MRSETQERYEQAWREKQASRGPLQVGIDYAEMFPHNGVWMLRYTSEPLKGKIVRAFGTNEIPTPFMTSKSFEDVVALLRPNNPHLAFVEASQ